MPVFTISVTTVFACVCVVMWKEESRRKLDSLHSSSKFAKQTVCYINTSAEKSTV